MASNLHQTSARLGLDLFFGEDQMLVAHGAHLGRIESLAGAGRLLERFGRQHDVVLVKRREVAGVAVDGQGLAFVDEAVQGNRAFAAHGQRVDHELLAGNDVAAGEDVGFCSLVSDRIDDGGTVAVKFHLRTCQQFLPVDLLADAVQHGRAVLAAGLVVVELRIESAFGVLDADALAERDAGCLAVLGADLSLAPAVVDHDAVRLAEFLVFLAHGHFVIAFEAVEVDALRALADRRAGHVRADVAAADDDDLAGHVPALTLLM